MAKIRKISYGDIIHVRKLISVVCSDNVMSYRRLLFLSVPVTHLQNVLYGVYFRRFPETYVVSDNTNKLKGVVSVKAQQGNPYKWQLRRLFFDKDSYEESKQLVDYIIAKFGARGVDTFYLCVDDTQTELIDLFINGCGFRYCSAESLWRVSNINFFRGDVDGGMFKIFKNSDCEKAAELYNDNLIPLYKSSLSKPKEEFADLFFKGMAPETVFKYVSGGGDRPFNGFMEIKTVNNTDYFLDMIVPEPFLDSLPYILSFAVNKIRKRNKNFKLYIKNGKYLKTGERIEEFCRENKFELLQNNAVLVKDFFKSAKETSKITNEAFFINGFEI